MFDSVEVRKDNQDMSIDKLVQGVKDMNKNYNIYYSNDMDMTDRAAFTQRLENELAKLK